MDSIIEFAKREIPLVIMVITLIILLVILSIRKRQEKNYIGVLDDVEVRYNKLKSTPLTFKLNKAMALAKVNDHIKQEVESYKESYDTNLKAISTLGTMFIEAEDALEDGDIKAVNNLVAEMESVLDLTEQSVSTLDMQLDGVLEQEAALRAHATDLKERFRQIKEGIVNKSNILSFSEEIIDVHVVNSDNHFKAFEEWMFVSEFDKAEEALQKITESLNKLDEILIGVPELLPVAQGVIPEKISKVSSLYTEVKNANIYLDHLDVTQALNLQTEQLSADLAELRAGEVESVKYSLDTSKNALDELADRLNQELSSHSDIIDKQKDIEANISEINELLIEANGFMEELLEKYEFEETNHRLNQIIKDSDIDITEYEAILESFQQETPSSEVFKVLDEYNRKLKETKSRVLKVHDEIATIKKDEKRAQEHLLKLQLIINEVQVKINEYRLPSISSSYESDVLTARDHVKALEVVLNEKYLDINEMNKILADAIDYVYKLYNNVNNIVGMAIMVENALVFANRYRSTYDEVDSALTRTELAFRNGEYTQALTIVLEVIETIHPNSYEELIKENSSYAYI